MLHNHIFYKTKFGRIRDYSSERKLIIDVVRKLRNLKKGKKSNWEDAIEWHLKYANLYGESVLALTITLTPSGCDWARKGGCTMCGEFEGSEKRHLLISNPQFHISQFASAIGKSEIWEAAQKEKKPISWLRINQEGNFTNPKEMNYKAQEAILRLAVRLDGIKRITIESRPQYLSENIVKNLENLFKDSKVELEIGMGVEAKNEVIRNVCVNKKGSNRLFINTVILLKKYNILPLAYITLKPPFLSEKEAIDEAVETAHFVKEIGFSRISLEPICIHSYTLVEALSKTGDYKVPWLWSVIEVIKRCKDISNILGIGGIGYYPIPKNYAHNYCTGNVDCNQSCTYAIMEYNKTREIKVFAELSCKCKVIWQCEYKQEVLPSSLKERINEQLMRVESLLYDYSKGEIEENEVFRNQRLIAFGSQ
ncbi:MAG: hypothetical protein NTZ33_02350 [Bacteroidetes bacterium]|nr:hypothetical protein [Bacteroidota bacterium]